MTLALVALAVAALLLPQTAVANAFLVRTMPVSGERLGAAPQSISLQFSEPIVGGERLVVETAAGDPATVGPIERLQGGLVLRVLPPALGDGVYVVSWQVLAEDGHQSLGEFAFAVGEAGQIPSVTTQRGSLTAWPEAAISWMLLAGLLLAVGGLASERFVWSPVERKHGITIRRLPVGWLLLVALAGAALQLLVLADRATGGAPLTLSWRPWAGILSTRPGLFAAVQAGLIAYALWMTPIRAIRGWLLLPLVAALAMGAVRGHAGASDQWWAASASVVHLIAVGFWIGALGHLAWVARLFRDDETRSVLAEGARRYAALALGLVGVVLMSGSVVAVALVSRPTDLLSTRYGQMLLAKLALVVAALALAFVARRGALPRVPGIRPHLLARITRAEIVSVLVIVMVAAALANTAPPRRVTAMESLLGPPPLTGSVLRLADLAGPLAVHLAATPDALRVLVLAPSGEPAHGTRFEIVGRAPDGASIDVNPRPCGDGCATTAFPWQAGTTTFTVKVASTEWDGGTVEFAVPWPPQPEAPDFLAQVIATMRSQPTFTLTERVSSGPGATSDNTFPIDGATFVPLEVYANGGASDIRPVPAAPGTRALTFFISGSSIWYGIEVDSEYRLQREVIVSPGHRIDRTFTYGSTSSP